MSTNGARMRETFREWLRRHKGELQRVIDARCAELGLSDTQRDEVEELAVQLLDMAYKKGLVALDNEDPSYVTATISSIVAVAVGLRTALRRRFRDGEFIGESVNEGWVVVAVAFRRLLLGIRLYQLAAWTPVPTRLSMQTIRHRRLLQRVGAHWGGPLPFIAWAITCRRSRYLKRQQRERARLRGGASPEGVATRRSGRKHKTATEAVRSPRVGSPPRAHLDPQQSTIDAEWEFNLWLSILALDELYRVPLLHHCQGCPYKDISAKLGRSEVALRRRVVRAREELKAALQPYYPELLPRTN